MNKATRGRTTAIVLLACRTFAVAVAVTASLLCPPGAVPLMLGAWLIAYTILVATRRPAWAPIAAGAGVVLLKRIPWPPFLIALGALALVAGMLDLPRVRALLGERRRWLPRAAALVLLAAWMAAAAEWNAAAHASLRSDLDPSRPVVCIGDSLTSGMREGEAFPEHLARLLSVPVVNFGAPGLTAEAALRKLPSVTAANPQAVVIELGGHDYLLGGGRAATKANLERIIAAADEAGARVILMEIPRGFMSDDFAGIEREIARERDLELVADTAVRKLVLWGPFLPPGMLAPGSRLSDDGLHPNARGARMLAREVAGALERVFGQSIRSEKLHRGD